MKTTLNILRIAITGILLVVLTVNLYFIGARYIARETSPKLLGFSTSVVLSGSMEPAFSAGDFLIYREQTSYQAGDIVIFSEGGSFVTHRIIEETDGGFITKGDANNTADANVLNPANIHGELVAIVPKLGSFLLFLRQPLGLLMLICTGLFLWELPNITNLLNRKKGKHEA